MPWTRGLLVFLLASAPLVWGGCADRVPLACQPGADDVIVADNAGAGSWAADGRTPRWSEEWRVGLPDRVAPRALWTARVRADGTVLAADLSAGALFEMDPRRDTLLAEQPLPPELVRAFAAVRLDARLPPPTVHVREPGGFLVVLPRQPIPGGEDERRVGFVLRVADDGAVLDTLYGVTVAVLDDRAFSEWPRPGTGTPLVAIGPGGAVALAGASTAYRIDVLRANLVDSLVVCRQAPPLPLTESERGDVEPAGSPPGLARLLASSRKARPPLELGRIFLGAGGRLWVQRERPDPQRLFAQPGGAAYDVFAAGGGYLGEVRAPGRAVLFGETAELVYGYEATEDGRVALVAWSLE